MKTRQLIPFLLTMTTLLSSCPAVAADAPVPPVAHGLGEGFHGLESATDPTLQAADPASLADFASRRYGLFICWGPVTLAGTELGWSRGAQVPAAEYDQLYTKFNPVKFDADAWVRIAKAAGMRYIVLVEKHLDGFCMWDTKQTDYNIMRTPFGRDVTRELADACRRGGLAFSVYYCIADWYHPTFPFSGPYYGPGQTPIKPTADVERYTQFMMKQLSELVANYGPVQCLWFDSMAGAHWPEQGRRLIPFLRALQPSILINNRAAVPGDYVTPEERIGRYRDDKPWESCMMIGQSWSWKADDQLKPFPKLLRALIHCAGGDGNLLLSVCPMPDGAFQPRMVDRLNEIGDWLKSYGESIYGTRGGPYKPTSFLASTRRDRNVYLHILRWDSDRLVLPPLPRKVVASSVLTGGTVSVEQTESALVISVPPADRQKIDTLVRLEMDGPVENIPAIALPAEVTMTASVTREPVEQYAAHFAVDSDPDTEWSAPEGQTSATLELTFSRLRTIKSVKYDESTRPVRIRSYAVDWWDGTRWVHLLTRDKDANYVVKFDPVTTSRLRLRVLHMEHTVTAAEIVVEDVEN
jgi:alpha-L-fucosidase